MNSVDKPVEMTGQLGLWAEMPAPVQLELGFPAPDLTGVSCMCCGATSGLVTLGTGATLVAICRLPGVCGLRQHLANAKLDGCTCGGIGGTGAHRPDCPWNGK